MSVPDDSTDPSGWIGILDNTRKLSKLTLWTQIIFLRYRVFSAPSGFLLAQKGVLRILSSLFISFGGIPCKRKKLGMKKTISHSFFVDTVGESVYHKLPHILMKKSKKITFLLFEKQRSSEFPWPT
ncbi:MAG TPA: hypothetical protein PKV75_04285 [Desulfobacterales bacterium]|nr:hypothetical protein [Desulfobacterales bacterium]